jgi:hypothetical protein
VLVVFDVAAGLLARAAGPRRALLVDLRLHLVELGLRLLGELLGLVEEPHPPTVPCRGHPVRKRERPAMKTGLSACGATGRGPIKSAAAPRAVSPSAS